MAPLCNGRHCHQEIWPIVRLQGVDLATKNQRRRLCGFKFLLAAIETKMESEKMGGVTNVGQANEMYAIGMTALDSLKQVDRAPSTAAPIPEKRRCNVWELMGTVLNLGGKKKNRDLKKAEMEIDA